MARSWLLAGTALFDGKKFYCFSFTFRPVSDSMSAPPSGWADLIVTVGAAVAVAVGAIVSVRGVGQRSRVRSVGERSGMGGVGQRSRVRGVSVGGDVGRVGHWGGVSVVNGSSDDRGSVVDNWGDRVGNLIRK